MRKQRPYRLRRRDGLRLRPRRGPLGFAEVAGRLSEDLLWVDGWFTSSSHGEIELSFRTEEGWREVVAARFSHPRPDLLEFPAAAGQILVFPAPGLSGDPAFLQSLSVRLDGQWFRWAHDRMVIRSDLVVHLPEKLETLSEDVEPSFRAFLRSIAEASITPEDSIFARHEVVLERLYPGAWFPQEEMLEEPEIEIGALDEREPPAGENDEQVGVVEELPEAELVEASGEVEAEPLSAQVDRDAEINTQDSEENVEPVADGPEATGEQPGAETPIEAGATEAAPEVEDGAEPETVVDPAATESPEVAEEETGEEIAALPECAEQTMEREAAEVSAEAEPAVLEEEIECEAELAEPLPSDGERPDTEGAVPEAEETATRPEVSRAEVEELFLAAEQLRARAEKFLTEPGALFADVEEASPAAEEPLSEVEEPSPASEELLLAAEEEPERSIFHGGEELPLGICIDDFLVVGDEAAVVHGWVFDLEEQVTHLDWLVPEGEPLRLLPGAFRYERFAVVEMYQPFFGRSAPGKHAFLAFLRGPAAAAPDGFFRLSTRDGDEIEVARPEPENDPLQARERLWELCRDHLGRRDLLESVLAPGLEELQSHLSDRVGISDLLSLGASLAEPRISIVLPVGEDLGLIEHQLAHLAHEGGMERTELILVLAEAILTPDVERWLHQLSALYDLPFRLVVTDHESSWARAASLGAAQARGRRLVSLGADVFPATAGWLESLDRAYKQRGAAAGILGPKMLYHDQTLQHAGFTFGKTADFSGSWSEVSSFRGLHRAYAGANEPRKVPALSAACWMIDRELFEILGGFGHQYFASDSEAIDLCLRASEGGYECWYLPEVEMYRLPGVLSPPSQKHEAAEAADLEANRRFDRWLLTRTWNDRIERLVAPAGSPARPMAVVSHGGRA